jgi:hypothetical protein
MPEDSNEDWPPRKARLRSIVWRTEGHLERGEYAQAARTAAQGFGLGADEELLRGLHHLAAAGWKHQAGDALRAARQLEHARRRLGRRRRRLVALVARELRS